MPPFYETGCDTLAVSYNGPIMYDTSSIEKVFDALGVKAQRSIGFNPEEGKTFERVYCNSESFFCSWFSMDASRFRFESSYGRGMDFRQDIFRSLGFVRCNVSRYDVRVDVPESLDVFRKIYAGPRRWSRIDFKSGSIWRAGKRRLRIYDKKIESKLDHRRWRIEVSYGSSRDVSNYCDSDGWSLIVSEKENGAHSKCYADALDFVNSTGSKVSFPATLGGFRDFVKAEHPMVFAEFQKRISGKKNWRRFVE